MIVNNEPKEDSALLPHNSAHPQEGGEEHPPRLIHDPLFPVPTPADQALPWITRWRRAPQTALIVCCLAIFIDFLIFSILIPIISVETRKRFSLNDTQLGLLLAAFSTGLFIFSGLFGQVSDRIGRKTPMLISLTGLALSTLWYATADSFVWLLLARFAQGCSSAGVAVMAPTMLIDVYGAGNCGFALSALASTGAWANVIGPALGGIMNERLGYSSVFILNISLCVVDFCGRLFIAEPRSYKKPEELGIDPDKPTPEGYKRLFSNKAFLSLFLLMVLINSIGVFAQQTVPLLLSVWFNLDTSIIGVIVTVVGITQAVLILVAGFCVDKFGKKRIVFIALMITGPMWPLLYQSTSFTLMVTIVIALTAVGLFHDLAIGSYLIELSFYVEPGNIGAAIGCRLMADSLGQIFGSLSVSFMSIFPYFWILVVQGCVLVGCGFLFLFITRDYRDASADAFDRRRAEGKPWYNFEDSPIEENLYAPKEYEDIRDAQPASEDSSAQPEVVEASDDQSLLSNDQNKDELRNRMNKSGSIN